MKLNKQVIESDFANSKQGWFICSCCGKMIIDETKNIIDFEGNTCDECQKYADEIFFETRIKLIMQNTSKQNKEKFRRMTLLKKKAIICKLIEKGIII